MFHGRPLLSFQGHNDWISRAPGSMRFGGPPPRSPGDDVAGRCGRCSKKRPMATPWRPRRGGASIDRNTKISSPLPRKLAQETPPSPPMGSSCERLVALTSPLRVRPFVHGRQSVAVGLTRCPGFTQSVDLFTRSHKTGCRTWRIGCP